MIAFWNFEQFNFHCFISTIKHAQRNKYLSNSGYSVPKGKYIVKEHPFYFSAFMVFFQMLNRQDLLLVYY